MKMGEKSRCLGTVDWFAIFFSLLAATAFPNNG
jgi:hypothetical protein